MRRAGNAAALALLTGACAAGADRAPDTRELDALLAGRTAQAPVECVQSPSTTRIVDGVLVAMRGRTIWRNETDAGCPGGGIDPVLILEPLAGSDQLCRNDRFRTVSRGASIPGGTCRVGRWIPYVKARSG